MKYPKPTPVVVSTLCSLCDEPWEAHGDDPTVLDCILLLKAKRYTPTSYTPYVPPLTSWRCPSCGNWIWGANHICPGSRWLVGGGGGGGGATTSQYELTN